MLESKFAHYVNGRWYLSSNVSGPEAATLKAYRASVRRVYGNLRGVRFASQGEDYVSIARVVGEVVPIRVDGYYLRL